MTLAILDRLGVVHDLDRACRAVVTHQEEETLAPFVGRVWKPAKAVTALQVVVYDLPHCPGCFTALEYAQAVGRRAVKP